MTSPYTIPAALRRVDDLIGPNRQWSPTNDQQRSFLEIHEIVRDEVARVPEIESIASWSAAEINAFLRQRGFSIQLPPLPPDGFGTAAALDVLLTWLAPGTDLPLTTPDQQTYPSVLMHSLAPSYSVPGHSNPVIALPTRTEDQVYLTMLDAPPQDELTMIATAREFSANLEPRGHVEVHFPKVALDVTVELDWLGGLWTTSQDGRRAALVYALRQTKVRMNELGVRIKEAVAMAMAAGPPPAQVQRHVVNRPFLMWVTRPSLSLPLFVGYITRDDWKDPGTL